MRIHNPLEFTENHRFYVTREFALSSLDYKMLCHIYQPMVGPFAIGLYQLLYQQLPGDKTGSSPLEQQRKIFLSLDLEPNEQGRKMLIRQTSKLEAIGLLQTSRYYVPDVDDAIFEYRLFPPLDPGEFFANQHLVMLLRDKIGKYSLLSLREEFYAPLPVELRGLSLDGENLSVPFYDIFKLNVSSVDVELEQALAEMAASRQSAVPWKKGGMSPQDGFDYGDILGRFPQRSYNRAYVENLKYRPEALAEINFVARKYGLTLVELCRLLDEDGVFHEDGSINSDVFQQKANCLFRQERKREQYRERFLHKLHQETPPFASGEEKPVDRRFYLEVPEKLQHLCDEDQYNIMLRNEPYTKVLTWFFPGKVPDHVLNLCEKVTLNYKIKEEVLNVLIHYLHTQPNASWVTNYVESIVTDLMSKQIETYEQAVEYFREQTKIRSKLKSKSSQKRGETIRSKSGERQKPKIPLAEQTSVEPVSDEEIQKILLKAKKLSGGSPS